jgi:predicted GNAT superfamily acetyltransferase
MTIDVERLATVDDFAACERLQRRLFGDAAGGAWLGTVALRAVHEAGGLLLGVRADAVGRELAAASVALATRHEGFAALWSCGLGVARDARGRGLGTALRLAERQAALSMGAEVVRAWVDPLDGRASHLLWNRVGAIGTSYERSAFGELVDAVHRGLATDRVRVEWWLRSPRTEALLDQCKPAAHLRVELRDMAVATRTKPGPGGQRALVDARGDASAPGILVEIPEDLEALRDADPGEARRWRLGTREVFEQLLGAGYLLVGLIHEGGRCFQLLERTDRSSALGRA